MLFVEFADDAGGVDAGACASGDEDFSDADIGSLFLRFVRGDVLMPRGETPDASTPRQYDKLAARHAAAPASRITMWNPLDQFHLRACACVMAYMQRRQTSRYSA